MKSRVLALSVALCALSCARPAALDGPSALESAKLFAMGPVGFGGAYSQEELQFEAILALAPNKAKQTLERLYLSGNPQAMSYALLGMHKLDRKRFAELLVSARVSDLTVDTMSGCIGSKKKLSAIAADVDSGKYDRWLR